MLQNNGEGGMSMPVVGSPMTIPCPGPQAPHVFKSKVFLNPKMITYKRGVGQIER